LKQLVVGGQTRTIGHFDELGLQFAQEAFYACVENVGLIVEVKIENGARYSAAFGNFLKGRVLVALDLENFERLVQDFVFSFFMFDGNRHFYLR
jgi:hypothetical protein